MKKGGLYITLVPKVKGLNLCIIIGIVHQFFGSCLIPLDPCTLIKEKKNRSNLVRKPHHRLRQPWRGCPPRSSRCTWLWPDSPQIWWGCRRPRNHDLAHCNPYRPMMKYKSNSYFTPNIYCWTGEAWTKMAKNHMKKL